MKKIHLIYFAIFLIPLILVFRNWFFSSTIIGGDWPYFYQENVNSFSFLPPLWNPVQDGGLGGISLVYALDSYLYFTGAVFSHLLQIPWSIVYKIFWFGMFLLLSTFSIVSLTKEIFDKSSPQYLLPSIFVYLANTYILMVVGGGQMGVALGYALLPVVFVSFIKILNAFYQKKSFRSCLIKSFIAGLFLALQVMFDFRIAYITLIGVAFYFLFTSRLQEVFAHKSRFFFLFLFTFIIPGVMTLLLHAFWLLPFLFAGTSSVSQLGSAYTTTNAVTFFSFAKLGNTIALLSPYWPENIFGKIGFMKAEFLLIPVLAFSSLFFINNKEKKNEENDSIKRAILFFALLGLIGAFLAKGANEPFGGLYLWMFNHIPGFLMFRDPTKWYMLVALSYSILLPYSIWNMYQWLQSQKRIALFHLPKVFILLVIFYFLFLIRPALFSQLHGTFVTHIVPQDYSALKEMLSNQHQFSRTLWFPKMQRYGFVNSEHPAIEAGSLFKVSTSAELINSLHQENIKSKLASLSVAYLIVPYDSEDEIFLKDRKYDESQMKKLVKELDKISWIKRDMKFKKLAVYKVQNYNDHFVLQEKGKLSYQKDSDTEYTVSIISSNKNTLIFNDNYSSYWIAEIPNQKIKSIPHNNLNSYQISETKGKELKIRVYFSLLKYYFIGSVISLMTLSAIVVLLVVLTKKKK